MRNFKTGKLRYALCWQNESEWDQQRK